MTTADAEAPRSRTRRRGRNGVLVTAAAAFVAGALGAVLGATAMSLRPEREAQSLHAMVHESLTLSAEQDRALHEIEASFAVTRTELEARLADANRELAVAIRAHPAYAPEVGEAVERIHAVMGELQQATIRHVYDMRAILTEEQAEVFDDRIARVLAESDD
jgi:hypothetical protein